MRSCEKMEWNINLYLDDMLPSEEEPVLKAHLAECPACRERLEQLRAMQQAVAGLDEPVPEELHQRILEHVARHAGEQPARASVMPLRSRRWLRTLTAVAACAALCVVAVRFLPRWTADEALAENAMHDQLMQDATALPNLESTPTNETASSADRNDLTGAPDTETVEDLSDVATDPGQLAVDMPPLLGQSSTGTAEKSIGRWLLARGLREAAPECLTQTTVYEGELAGEAVSYVEISAFAQDYWLDQLTACGFTVTELENEALTADGQYIRLYFSWTE